MPLSSSVSSNESRVHFGDRHFYFLDALRGLAAVVVVLWHWSAFAMAGEGRSDFQIASQPFYSVFAPFYNEGWRAVDLFFCLSGFIFYWLYQERISQGLITSGKFWLLRFSRLYPLHLLTLLIVAAGQGYMQWMHGTSFVHSNNDLRHFILQLFLASNWGFEKGFSFNGPIWSVSVEVLVYGLFFALCRLNIRQWWHLVGLVASGLAISIFVNDFVGRGIVGFFAGGLAFYLCRNLVTRPKAFPVLACAAVVLWILIPWNTRQNVLLAAYQNSPLRALLTVAGRDVVGAIIERLSVASYQLILFPLTITCIALWERQKARSLKWAAWLGDISYASYLWHFPLQLAFFAGSLALGLNGKVFMTPWMMGLFFLVLAGVSSASHRYFERPCQNWIRQRWKLKGRSVAGAPLQEV